MKVKLLLVFLFLTAVQFCHGQRAPYIFSYRIDSIAKVDSDDQHQGINYSYIGNYRNALEIFEPYHRKLHINKEQADTFKHYHPVSAQKYILERAKNSEVIIINEAHHIPLHRVFMASLLQGLHEEGYDILAMETFNDNDSTISRRGYPQLSSGWYSAEPCYGNMIRKALDLKYRLFGYEISGGGEREVKQAENIARQMRENPNSKFVIYCGYDHLIKDTMPGDDSWHHAMAGWLKLMTGVEAFTIDQVTLTETGEDSMDNPYRRLMNYNQDVIILNDSGGSLRPKPRYNADVSVYHPNTKYIHGRPDWQITDDKRTENINAKITIGYPCLAFVFRTGENYEEAVPTDVVEIGSKDDSVHVILEKNYRNTIILKNPQGERQIINE